VLVSLHLVRDEATVYLDFSGRPLHLRGYRRDILEAPLKETLAASLLRLAGYRGDAPFLDPMCGSGTIAIEAALVASRTAPGLSGGRFGFERWTSFDATEKQAWDSLRERARARRIASEHPIFARDVSADALTATRGNAERAGVELRVERASVASLRDDPAGHVVTNPPYGERIAMPVEVERAMGRSLSNLPRSTVGVLAAGPSTLEALGRRPDRMFEVYNGDIECRFAVLNPSNTPTT
jgi:23S rRNA G2445 N2-methylase RlmL